MPALALVATFVAGACNRVPTPDIIELQTMRGLDQMDPEIITIVDQSVRAVRAAPRDRELRAKLAMVYEANLLWEEGRLTWIGALALGEDEPNWRYHLSICCRQVGESERARALLRETIAAQPNFPAAQHRLGDMLLENGENTAARTAFEAALALAPGQAPVQVGLAEALLREKQYERARGLCAKALKTLPDYKRAHYNLGLALRGLGRRDEAEAELNLGLNAEKDYLPDPLSKEIASYKRSYVVRLQEAASYFDKGNAAHGITILEKVIKLHSDDIAVVNNLASMYLQVGRIEDANKLFQLALSMEPNRFSTYINLAQSELASKNNLKAYEYADKAVELSSGKSSSAFLTRARVLLAMGQASEAYRDLKKAVKYDATDWTPHAYLGDVAIQLHLYEDAVKHFDQAIKLKPDHLPAHTRRAWVLNELGRTKQARAGYERARFLAPNSSEVVKLARLLGIGK